MAATVAEAGSVAAVPLSGSHSELRVGEGKGAVGDERDAGTKGAEALGDSEEDGEDVFEVERILDMKTEGVRELAGPWGRGREVSESCEGCVARTVWGTECEGW